MPVGYGITDFVCWWLEQVAAVAFEVPRRLLVRLDSWLEVG